MRLSFFFALRYIFSRSRLGVVGWISTISAVAIGVVSMAMVLVLSVYNGYVAMIEQSTGLSTPELVVAPVRGSTLELEEGTPLWQALHSDSVESYALVLEGMGMLRAESGERLVQVLGVGSAYWDMLPRDSLLLEGRFPETEVDGSAEILLGLGALSGLQSAGVRVEEFSLLFPRRQGVINPLFPNTAFRSRSVRLAGVLNPVDEELDRRAYVPLDLMQELLAYPAGTASCIAVRGSVSVDELKRRLATYIGDSYRLLDRREQHPELTLLIRMEKLMVYVIMLFILLLAAFNLICGLAMLIMEKRSDLAMLSALGMTVRARRRIFALSGLLVALFGSAVGLLVGTGLSLAQQSWGIVRAGSDDLAMPFPIVMRPMDFLLILCAILGIAVLTSAALSLFMREK